MSLLAGFRVAQLGTGLAAAVAGRLFADLGATVSGIDLDRTTPLAEYLNAGKADSGESVLAGADLIFVEGRPKELKAAGHDPVALRKCNAKAVIVAISPFGQSGPRADEPASDLTLLYSSGIAKLLTGQVDDLAEAPIRPVGLQSAFIGGLAAASAGMQAMPGAVIDVSIEEALATMAMTELANAGLDGKARSRRRIGDGNGATVCILPASDGYAAISPREDRQWAAWLEVMGSPEWSRDQRFATKPDRVANWDALHALMSAWSRQHAKQWIANRAQEAHVPSFPLREPEEQLSSPQLDHRDFWRPSTVAGKAIKTPRPPFGLSLTPGPGTKVEVGALPLSGVRVLDFSWVIAGPTTTRYLAAMGAEVIKVEAPGSCYHCRSSELYTVLGQAKKGIVLDLKKPEAVGIARDLAARCDVLVENFATGVMDRLGLGAAELQALNPNLIYVSASGMGRTGPEAQAVAYGTLLQCYAGFAGLNRHRDVPPRVGFAWLDPMCGLMLAFIAAASLWRRGCDGTVARVDFSMIEAMLWTMAVPLLATQLGEKPRPQGNDSERYLPHGAWRCSGDDQWLAIAVTSDRQWAPLCAAVPGMASLAGIDLAGRREKRREIEAMIADWARGEDAVTTAAVLRGYGVPAAALMGSTGLVEDAHLRARGFWDEHADGRKRGVLPGLPWCSSFGRATGPAPALGGDTDGVLRDVLGLAGHRIAELRASGAFG